MINRWFATTLFDDSPSANAKSCHGRSAQYANTGYGMPSDGIFPKWLKTTVNTIIVKNGWMTAHATPSAVCL